MKGGERLLFETPGMGLDLNLDFSFVLEKRSILSH